MTKQKNTLDTIDTKSLTAVTGGQSWNNPNKNWSWNGAAGAGVGGAAATWK